MDAAPEKETAGKWAKITLFAAAITQVIRALLFDTEWLSSDPYNLGRFLGSILAAIIVVALIALIGALPLAFIAKVTRRDSFKPRLLEYFSVVALVVSLLTVSGRLSLSDGSDPSTLENRQEFIAGCIESGGAEGYCGCVYDYLAQNYNLREIEGQFIEWEKAGLTPESAPSPAVESAKACLAKHLE